MTCLRQFLPIFLQLFSPICPYKLTLMNPLTKLAGLWLLGDTCLSLRFSPAQYQCNCPVLSDAKPSCVVRSIVLSPKQRGTKF